MEDLTPAQRKAKKLKQESLEIGVCHDEEKELFEKVKEEKRKAKEIERKANCLKKITTELREKFAKEGSCFSIYQEDIQHQFHSINFKRGCKICGDTNNVEEQTCGLRTCNDCKGCVICNWIDENYDGCAGIEDNDCYGCCLIVPDRKPSHDYYNLENEPICHYCNQDLPKKLRRLGFSKKLEKQLQEKEEEGKQLVIQGRTNREQRIADMTETEKIELFESWKLKRPLLDSPCVKCRNFRLCCCMSGYCFSCWTEILFNPDEWFGNV